MREYRHRSLQHAHDDPIDVGLTAIKNLGLAADRRVGGGESTDLRLHQRGEIAFAQLQLLLTGRRTGAPGSLDRDRPEGSVGDSELAQLAKFPKGR